MTYEACSFCYLSYFWTFLVTASSLWEFKCFVCNKTVHPVAVSVIIVCVLFFKSAYRSRISRSLPGWLSFLVLAVQYCYTIRLLFRHNSFYDRITLCRCLKDCPTLWTRENAAAILQKTKPTLLIFISCRCCLPFYFRIFPSLVYSRALSRWSRSHSRMSCCNQRRRVLGLLKLGVFDFWSVVLTWLRHIRDYVSQRASRVWLSGYEKTGCANTFCLPLKLLVHALQLISS